MTTWRCFHCDESFADRAAARDRFGRTEYSQPACHINAAEYREMKERMRRYNNEDSDLHRELHAAESRRRVDVRRAEEVGYARGLADAQKYPAELGLQLIEAITS